MDKMLPAFERKCAEEIEKLSAVITALISSAAKKDATISEALDRIADMLKADDGQAYKEAERFYDKHRKVSDEDTICKPANM